MHALYIMKLTFLTKRIIDQRRDTEMPIAICTGNVNVKYSSTGDVKTDVIRSKNNDLYPGGSIAMLSATNTAGRVEQIESCIRWYLHFL